MKWLIPMNRRHLLWSAIAALFWPLTIHARRSQRPALAPGQIWENADGTRRRVVTGWFYPAPRLFPTSAGFGFDRAGGAAPATYYSEVPIDESWRYVGSIWDVKGMK